jgi:hypothetical protein
MDAMGWFQLGAERQRAADYPGALAAYGRGLALPAPVAAQAMAWSNVAQCRRSIGDAAGEVTAFTRAVALEPGHVGMHIGLATALLAQGRLLEGWREYGWRLLAMSDQHRPAGCGAPRWRGQDLAGRSLLVVGEQGVTDEIMFLSCLGDAVARGGRISVICQARLVSAVRRSFPGVAAVAAHHAPDAPLGGHDWYAPIGELARHFRRDLGSFGGRRAYLAGDPARVVHWRRWLATLGPGFKLGIAWRSRRRDGMRGRHYTGLDDWHPVFAIPGLVLVNLMYDDTASEVAALAAAGGPALHRPPGIDLLQDIDDSLALVAALDGVAACSGATANIAGAVGQRLVRFEHRSGAWMGLGTADAVPWFPGARQRYCRPGEDWAPAMAAIAADVREWAA